MSHQDLTVRRNGAGRGRSGLSVLGFGLLLLVAVGCGGKEGVGENESEPIVRSATGGGVTFSVTVDKSRAQAGEAIALTLSLEGPANFTLTLPVLADRLGDLFLSDAAEQTSESPDGQTRTITRTAMMRAYLDGQVELPVLKARYVERREGVEDAMEQELETEPIVLEIATQLAADADPAKPSDIKSPVSIDLPGRLVWIWWVVGGVVGVVGLAALLLWWVRRKTEAVRAVAERIVPAHEWAFERLRLLKESDLPSAGKVQAYYYALSDIVRGYIERRFGLQAPERTTDEFLEMVRDDAHFSTEHKAYLGDFLAASDLVKFARHEPQVEELNVAYAAAWDFVERTAERTGIVAGERQEVAA